MNDLDAFIVPHDLLNKYAKPGPRYTSYPTAPVWDDRFDEGQALKLYTQNQTQASGPLSLYFHLPFCTSLCWYCGCNVKISRNKRVTEPYLKALTQEMEHVSPYIQHRKVSQMHWGGGTPTYLSPEQIERLVSEINQHVQWADNAELSIEVDPRVTTFEHLQALRRCGFNRLSMGIQDFNPKVQEAVHRIQSFETTAQLIQQGRDLGFTSINVDLMYGLPYQSVESFRETLQHIQTLSPDRIALFHYAHVPWMKPAQKLIPTDAIPDADTKMNIFEMAIRQFLTAGYQYIGMDHFARPEDELSVAQRQRTLRRNFMGYTTQAGTDLYGFGVSSISEIDGHFIQNVREVPAYEERLSNGTLPTLRGMWLSPDDHLRKAIIEALCCNGYLNYAAISQRFAVDFQRYFQAELAACQGLAEDGLLSLNDQELQVLPRGQMLIRNVCMVWDHYLQQSPTAPQTFSRTL